MLMTCDSIVADNIAWARPCQETRRPAVSFFRDLPKGKILFPTCRSLRHNPARHQFGLLGGYVPS